MQTQPRRKYNLRSSENRMRESEKQGEVTPQVLRLALDKGKGDE